MARNPGRTGRPWRRLCAQVYAEETHCWICHHPVNMLLRSPDPMSRSIDHVIPLSKGGPPVERSNVRLAHLRCNTSRGNHEATHPNLRTSRPW